MRYGCIHEFISTINLWLCSEKSPQLVILIRLGQRSQEGNPRVYLRLVRV